jgi:hypothetical protein
MSNIYYIIIGFVVFLLMFGVADAACTDVRNREFLHKETTAAGLPISGANCTIYMSNSQHYNNVTEANGITDLCINTSVYVLNLSCRKPSTYNAVLSSLDCPDSVYLDGRISAHLKLTNTLGEALEAQDCYVKVFNERGYMTEDLKTNLLYKNQTFLDSNGNYVRLTDVPLTSSAGNYDLGWIARSKDKDGFALYRPYQNYTVRADCNGKVANCTFKVDNKEPIHVDDNATYLMDNMQVLTLGAVVILLGLFFIVPSVWRTIKGE